MKSMITGSRSTFEFPSQVNLSGPAVPSSMNRTSRCNNVDAVRPMLEFTFTKGADLHVLKYLLLFQATIYSYSS